MPMFLLGPGDAVEWTISGNDALNLDFSVSIDSAGRKNDSRSPLHVKLKESDGSIRVIDSWSVDRSSTDMDAWKELTLKIEPGKSAQERSLLKANPRKSLLFPNSCGWLPVHGFHFKIPIRHETKECSVNFD